MQKIQNVQKVMSDYPHAGIPQSVSQVWCKFVCPWLVFTDPVVIV